MGRGITPPVNKQSMLRLGHGIQAGGTTMRSNYGAARGALTVGICLTMVFALRMPSSGVERQKVRGHVPEAVARLKLSRLAGCRPPTG